jgi:ketosteroid isomerase-like protein
MSQENVEIVRRAVQAFNRHEIELEFFHPEVEWIENPRFPGAKTYRGRDGVKRSVEDWWDTWALVMRVEEIVDAGDRVAFWGVTKARGHNSDVTVSGPFGGVWEFRDGMAVRVHVLGGREEALEAVGLSE